MSMRFWILQTAIAALPSLLLLLGRSLSCTFCPAPLPSAPFLPTPVHLLLSSLTPSEHVALPRLLPCTQLRISLPGAASLVLIYSRHACHSHDANNQVLQKRQKRSLNPQFLTLIRYHSHRSLGASKNSTATAPCSTWGDQCIR